MRYNSSVLHISNGLFFIEDEIIKKYEKSEADVFFLALNDNPTITSATDGLGYRLQQIHLRMVKKPIIKLIKHTVFL